VKRSPLQVLKVLVVDDHPVVLSGCRSVFQTRGHRVEGVENAENALKAFTKMRPDVVLVDINLPNVSGFELIRRILKKDADARIIVFSVDSDPIQTLRAIESGARGYVSKTDDPRDLLEAVEIVATGGTYLKAEIAKAIAFESARIRANPQQSLTPREAEIVRLLAQGKNISEIAHHLNISYKTVANTTSLLKKKVGARSHSDLIRLAVELNVS